GLKKILYVFLFMLIAFSLTGCFNEEEKANAIIDFFNKVDRIEDNTESMLGDYRSNLREVTKNGEPSDMIQLIEEDFIPAVEKQIDAVDNMDLTYKATKKLHDLHMDTLTE